MSQTFTARVERRAGVLRGMVDVEETFVVEVEPTTTNMPDGSTRISVGFPALIVSGWVADPEAFATRVAKLLTQESAQ